MTPFQSVFNDLAGNMSDPINFWQAYHKSLQEIQQQQVSFVRKRALEKYQSQSGMI